MNQYGISQAEWTLMKVLWQRGALTATDVHEALAPETEWHAKTVRTLLGRLVAKGAVKREKRGGALRFSAIVAEEDCVREEGRSFLDRCFGGALKPMLAHFIESEEMDPETLRELRSMVEAKMKQRRKP